VRQTAPQNGSSAPGEVPEPRREKSGSTSDGRSGTITRGRRPRDWAIPRSAAARRAPSLAEPTGTARTGPHTRSAGRRSVRARSADDSWLDKRTTEMIEIAATLAPSVPRVQLRLGVLLIRMGRRDAAFRLSPAPRDRFDLADEAVKTALGALRRSRGPCCSRFPRLRQVAVARQDAYLNPEQRPRNTLRCPRSNRRTSDAKVSSHTETWRSVRGL